MVVERKRPLMVQIGSLGNSKVHPGEAPVVHKPPFERTSGVTGLGNLGGLSGPAPKDTDTLSPRPVREIMGEGNPMMEEPVTDPAEHRPDGNDSTLPTSK